jgi:hypothetical protein
MLTVDWPITRACNAQVSDLEPPFAGGGLLHDLFLVITALPHVSEHELHAPHALQFPCTTEYKRYV